MHTPQEWKCTKLYYYYGLLKKLVVTGPQPVFEFHSAFHNHNWTNCKLTRTATTVQSKSVAV